jgi:hypothetical protein
VMATFLFLGPLPFAVIAIYLSLPGAKIVAIHVPNHQDSVREA